MQTPRPGSQELSNASHTPRRLLREQNVLSQWEHSSPVTERLMDMFSRPFPAESCPRQRGQPIESPQWGAEHTWHINRNRKPAQPEWSGVSERGRGRQGLRSERLRGSQITHALIGRWLVLGEMGSHWKVLGRDMI